MKTPAGSLYCASFYARLLMHALFRHVAALVLLPLMAITVSACGNKGDLYLPVEQSVQTAETERPDGDKNQQYYTDQ